jgi:hypothetical protein
MGEERFKMESAINQGHPNPGFETVFTVTEYYDGPRVGVANYCGKPHFYECIFDEDLDTYTESFWLTPISEETFRLTMEDWTIWRRWEFAFHAGKVGLDTHPALPPDSKRCEELKTVLKERLKTSPSCSLKLHGEFTAIEGADLPKGVLRPLQVLWTSPISE